MNGAPVIPYDGLRCLAQLFNNSCAPGLAARAYIGLTQNPTRPLGPNSHLADFSPVINLASNPQYLGPLSFSGPDASGRLNGSSASSPQFTCIATPAPLVGYYYVYVVFYPSLEQLLLTAAAFNQPFQFALGKTLAVPITLSIAQC